MRKLAILVVAIGLLAGSSWAGDTKAEHLQRARDAADVFQQLLKAPDDGIPQGVLESAQCVAVVPRMFKAGFVFGGRHGEGLATCRLDNGSWSAPAYFTVTGGSWGAQIGAESVDLVMMIMNEEGMKGLLSGNFEIGAGVSAAAGPVGRAAHAKAGWDAAILTYSRSKGLFAGAVLEGAKVSKDEDATEDIYGNEKLSASDILTGKVKTPAGAPRAFVQTVANAYQMAKAGSNPPPGDE